MSTSNAERALALAAAIVVPLSLRMLPLGTVLHACDRWPVRATSGVRPVVLARRVDRWLGVGRGPWKSTCLTRSLVLYTMLRQHGLRPRVHIGVAGNSSKFAGHAWVTLNGEPVGEPAEGLETFRPILVHGA
ncbi:MAG: lasso peptide biosynthesis B2 protein [Gemmatimonadaceae bacterium]